MAGHSAWKNIKHRKAAVDARRGKMWSKSAKLIIVAAKNGGGDPTTNLSLRYAIEDARAVNMPRDTIEKAIKKGTGELVGENYESAMYEGYGPGGIAFLCEILTDNRNRTAPDLKRIFDKNGGAMGSAGCVSYMFHSKGQIVVAKSAIDEDALMTLVLDAGAEDVASEGDHWLVTTEPSAFIPVRTALEKAKLTLDSAAINMVPNMTVPVSGEAAKSVLQLIDALEDNDDVQKVHVNADFDAAELEQLQKA